MVSFPSSSSWRLLPMLPSSSIIVSLGVSSLSAECNNKKLSWLMEHRAARGRARPIFKSVCGNRASINALCVPWFTLGMLLHDDALWEQSIVLSVAIVWKSKSEGLLSLNGLSPLYLKMLGLAVESMRLLTGGSNRVMHYLSCCLGAQLVHYLVMCDVNVEFAIITQQIQLE